MELKEKASYIIGLVDGLEPDFTTKEGKILKEVMQLLVNVCEEVSDLKTDVEQIYDELDAIDQDLSDVEEELFESPEELFDGGIYELTCPECEEIVCLDEEMMAKDDLSCPACGTKFELDFDEEDEE